MRRWTVLVVTVLAVLAGCGWPRDVGTTLQDVRGGVLRVGVTENPPWIRMAPGGDPEGAEAELVRKLAGRLGATVQWYPGSESALMAALKDRVLDVVVGGLDAAAPWTAAAMDQGWGRPCRDSRSEPRRIGGSRT